MATEMTAAVPAEQKAMHGLGTKLPVGYFLQDLVHREEERVSHDIIKACAELEKRCWPHLHRPLKPSYWAAQSQRILHADTEGSAPAAKLEDPQSVNGFFQHFVEQPLHKLAGEALWLEMNAQLSRTVSRWIAVVGHVLKQEVSLDDVQKSRDDELQERQRVEQHIIIPLSVAPTSSSPSSVNAAPDLLNPAGVEFVTVGNSRLVVDEGTMVHVWTNPRSARNFVQLWSRVWQAIVEHRIIGIHCPFSAMFCVQGEYVSVTALPPLQLMNQACCYYPALDCARDGFLSYSAARLSRALLLPVDAPFPLINAVDGRFYLVSIEALLVKDLQVPGFDGTFLRTELLQRQLLLGAALEPGDACITRMPSTVFLREHAIPQLVDHLLLEILPGRRDDQLLLPARMVSDHVLRNAFHKFGVNMNLLYYVLRVAKVRRGRISNAPQPAGKRTAATKAVSDANKSLFDLLQCLVYSEMVGRVLKQFARADMIIHNSLGKRSEADRLDVVNRITQFIMGNSPTFWAEHVLPAVREKFALPRDFALPIDAISPAAALKVMTLKIGCEFSLETLRFVRFNTVTGIWPVFADTNRPVVAARGAAATLARKRASPEPGGVKLRQKLQLLPMPGVDTADGEELVRRMIAAAEQFPAASIARQTFLVRACAVAALRFAGIEDPASFDRVRKTLLRSIADLKEAGRRMASETSESLKKAKSKNLPPKEASSPLALVTLRPDAVAKYLPQGNSAAAGKEMPSPLSSSPYASPVMGRKKSSMSALGAAAMPSMPSAEGEPLVSTIPSAGDLLDASLAMSQTQNNTTTSAANFDATTSSSPDVLASSVLAFFSAHVGGGGGGGGPSSMKAGGNHSSSLLPSDCWARGIVVALEECLVDTVAAEMVAAPSARSAADLFDKVVELSKLEAHANGHSHGVILLLLLRAVDSTWGSGAATTASGDLWMIPRLLAALKLIDEKAPWIDVYFSDASEELLRRMEEAVPTMSSELVSEAAKVISEVYAMHGRPSHNRRATVGIPYAARALRALVMAPKACELPRTHSFARELIADAESDLGPDADLTLGFYYCFAASASARAGDLVRMVGGQRLIVRADTAPQQLGGGEAAGLSIARSAPTSQLMLNMERELAQRGDQASSALVHKFLLSHGKWYCALLLVQTVGRGYLDRSLIRRWQLVLQHRRDAAGSQEERRVAALADYLSTVDPSRVPEAAGLLAKYGNGPKLQQLAVLLSEQYGGDSTDILRGVLLFDAGAAPQSPRLVPPAYAPDFLKMYISDVGSEITVGLQKGRALHPVKAVTSTSADKFASSAGKSDGIIGTSTESGVGGGLDDIVKRVFLLCDTDSDGLVTANACFAMMDEMKIMKTSELRSMFLAKHGSRLINFPQFREMVLHGTVPEGIVGGSDLSPAYYGNECQFLPPLAYPKQKQDRGQKLPLLRRR